MKIIGTATKILHFRIVQIGSRYIPQRRLANGDWLDMGNYRKIQRAHNRISGYLK